MAYRPYPSVKRALAQLLRRRPALSLEVDARRMSTRRPA